MSNNDLRTFTEENKLNDKPQKVYIYFSRYAYLKMALTRQAIYFNTASASNDIFDSTVADWDLVLRQILYDRKTFLKFVSSTQKKHIEGMLDLGHISTMHGAFVRVFKMLSKSEIANLLDGLSRHPLYRQAQYRLAYFTEDNNSLLMWAHYGCALKGYCLELSTALDPDLFSRLKKVEYGTERNTEMDINLYFKKSNVWQYEKEWRIATDPGDPLLSKDHFINTKAISGIIIGERVRNKKCVKKLAEKFNLDVYIAKANAHKYKIDIEPEKK